jgi:N,N'-diacetyllegionaminate synthase
MVAGVRGSLKTFIIAEAGVNHNGDAELALEMVEIAAKCGADAIKFQTFKADRLVQRGAAKADYQMQQTGDGDQHSMLKSLEMSEALHIQLVQRCLQCGIEFMSTAFDEDSALFLKSIGVRRLKVPSGEITNVPLLRYFSSLLLPIILSTGMADLQEVEFAVRILTEERERLSLPAFQAGDVTILHCTSNYPASPDDVNLRAMVTMANTLGCPVGYSDHTLGVAVSTAAVALGAIVIEKHFTTDRNLPGPDHAASLTPTEFGELVTQIRAVERALGSAEKRPAATELPVRALVRRSIFISVDLPAGAVLSLSQLEMLRPADGIPVSAVDEVVGRTTNKALRSGHRLDWSDFA